MFYLHMTHCLSHLIVFLNWTVPQKMDTESVYFMYFIFIASKKGSVKCSSCKNFFSRIGKQVDQCLFEWERLERCVVVGKQEV